MLIAKAAILFTKSKKTDTSLKLLKDKKMNKLFEMFDRYVDEKIIAKTNELEGLQIRDANRIADLERRLSGAVDMIEIQRGWIDKLNDAKGLDFDVAEAEQALEDFEYRISELECTIEDKADCEAVETTIDNIISNMELPDLETAAYDAVVTILSRERFKLILEE
jgi:hypothetical protein